MPTYEYQCSACGHQLEDFQKMTDAPLTVCPKCQTSNLQKLVSAAGFQLKGTGWYVTDFRDKGKKPPESAKPGPAEGNGADAKSKGAEATPANTQPAAKTDKKESTSSSTDNKEK